MAANQKQEVELLIKAGVEGLKSVGQIVKELQALGEDTSEASEQLETLAGSLKSLRDQQKLIQQFADLKNQTRALAKEQGDAKDRATALGKALAQTEKPTRAQRNEFEKAKKASREADKAWQDNQRQLNELRTSLQNAGVSTRDLSSEQQRVKREIAGVEDEIGGLSRELSGLRDRVKKGADGTEELNGRFAALRRRLKEARPELAKVRAGLATIGKVAAGATAALGASVATLTIFSKRQADAARDITTTAEAIGISAQRLQEWQIAGKQFNIEGEKISDVLKDVTEKVGEFSATGGGEAADVFKQLNLSIRDFRDLSPDQQLLKLAEAISQVDSRSEQVSYLEQLADDASRLLPLLDNNAEALRRIAADAQARGAIYSDADLAKLAKADQIYNQIDIKLQGLANRVGAELAPTMARATDAILDLFDSGDKGEQLLSLFKRLITSSTDFLTRLANNSDAVESVLGKLGTTLSVLGNTAKSVFSFMGASLSAFGTLVAAQVAGILSAVQGVSYALSEAGVVSESTYNAIREKAEAARAKTAELAKQTADYAKGVTEGVGGVVDAFGDAEKASKKAGDQVKDTIGTLQPLLDEVKASGDEAKDALEKQEAAARRARSQLEGMGVEAGRALDGISKGARDSIDQLTEVAEEIDKLGTSGQKSADIFRNGVIQALKDVSTAEEFKLIDQKVRELFGEGKIDDKALQEALLKIRERQREIGKQKLSQGTDELKDSADRAAESVKGVSDEMEAAGENAKEAGDEFRSAWGAAFGAALSTARESVTALSDAARNLYETRIGGNAFVQSTKDARDELEKARQEVGRLSKASIQLQNNSFADWFNDVALQAARVREEFYQQKVRLDDLITSVNGGSYSLQGLANLSKKAADNFNLLDDQQLSGLQSAIDSARSKLEGLNSSAESTLNSLRQRLADLRGDTEESQRLEYESQRAQLESQLKAAREAGATSAAADYRQALDQLQEIYTLEQKKAREAAAEREKENQLLEKKKQERQAETQQQSTTTNNQQSQASSSRTQTIVLQSAAGREVAVQTEDPEGLLSVLESSGMRSSV